jgi:diguanylate cyclase (GGDEF)-like protein
MHSMNIVAASVYWVIVFIWLTVLGVVLTFYIRNPRVFGTTRLLLVVLAIDTVRNIVENVYFGLYFGGQYGLFSPSIVGVLGNAKLLIIPKLINIAAGCVVLCLLLLRWLPAAVREYGELEQSAEDLKTLAELDSLTGLYNRRHFELTARAEWDRFQRYLRPLSLLIIDVDRFKQVNDRFGHDAGDAILKIIADTCVSAKRKSDLVARIGGEEFAMLMPETDEASARIVAERLLEKVRNCSPAIGDERLSLTVSIGISAATLSMSGFETLVKRADGALYEAKRSGRNRIASATGKVGDISAVAAE